MIEFLNLKRVNEPIEAAIQSALDRVVQRGSYILGPECDAFESTFAEYVGARYAIGTGNGLDALTLMIRALDFPSGSEIIVPANTYIATILAIEHSQCRPILVEPSTVTFNLDPDRIESAITPRTVAILAVDLYGQVSD